MHCTVKQISCLHVGENDVRVASCSADLDAKAKKRSAYEFCSPGYGFEVTANGTISWNTNLVFL